MTAIYINGPPLPLKRVSEKSANGCHWRYDPQKKEKDAFRNHLKEYLLNHPDTAKHLTLKKEYRVNLCFMMPYPKYKVRKNMLELLHIPHTTKPDIDNLIKFVLDCGNELLWNDDKMITRITASKYYYNEPKTIISIE